MQISGGRRNVTRYRKTAEACLSSRRRRSRLITGLMVAGLFLVGTSTGAQSDEDEYRVKAAFLFHFAQLVDWPSGTVTGTTQPLLICTVGEDLFHGALETTVAGKAIGARVISVLHLKFDADMTNCQILFVGQAQSKRIPTLLAGLGKAPVLTVGETADFLGTGGMIRFLLQDDKVRFEINLDAAKSANLRISSRLLILAQNVLQESRGR
jgi:hypothetical protein